MKSLIQFKTPTLLSFVPLVLAFFALAPAAQAVVPPPDGGYANFTTAEGTNALKNLTSGAGNTAVGWYSLFSASATNFNTAVGAGTLALNTGEQNTAIGTGALLFNTIGVQNTASGIASLINNDTGSYNTAEGDQTLLNNTTGGSNTAIGDVALYYNTNGSGNTAIGAQALNSNSTGNYNTALGFAAGAFLTTGNNNIDIGLNVGGVAGESNTIRIGNDINSATYIAGISGATTSGGAAVFVDALGKLGTLTSSARFKRDIQPMGSASETILALRPVSFRYKKELDPKGLPQFGLVAEDVEKVSPELIIRDAQGAPQTVRYEQINAMLLNEFLKEHKAFVEEQRKVQEQATTIAQLKKTLDAVLARLDEHDSKIQGVSDQVKASQPLQVTLSQR